MPTDQIIIFDNISHIQYNKGNAETIEEAMENGPLTITLFLKDGTTYVFEKPLKIQRNGKEFFLKIPNPSLHKPEIAYVETAIAKLGALLMPQHGVLIAKYELIDIALDNPNGERTPCCLIEALEFTPFGECGTDFQADSSKVLINDEEKQEKRDRQLSLLYSPAFAAFSAFCHLIGNNDTHQENFGTAIKKGCERFAAIDFDMSPMPFLTHYQLFGPYNEVYQEQDYNLSVGGRHTPNELNFGIFPLLSENNSTPTPDNWVTTWCHGYAQGLKQCPPEQIGIFRNKVSDVFHQFAALDSLIFAQAFEDIVPHAPQLMDQLTLYFEQYTIQLKDALNAHPKPLEAWCDTPWIPSPQKSLSGIRLNSSFFNRSFRAWGNASGSQKDHEAPSAEVGELTRPLYGRGSCAQE